MVSLVLVSHSRPLAEATLKLVRAMSGMEVPIAIAAGAGDDHQDLGTDAVEISEAIQSVAAADGVVVLMDLGSAILSAEMALDFLDESLKAKVRLCPASFVEGSVAAGVAAKIGHSVDEVLAEARASLTQKNEHIAPEEPQAEQRQAAEHAEFANAQTVRVIVPNPSGLHARPVARLIQEAAKFNSRMQIRNLTNGKGPVSIRSMTGIVALEALRGHEVELSAVGADADKALDNLRIAIKTGLGDSLLETPESAAGAELQPVDMAEGKPIGVSKGVVIGTAYFPQKASYELPDSPVEDPRQEIAALQTALKGTLSILKRKAAEVSRTMGSARGEIFLAQAMVLQDPALMQSAEKLIRENNHHATYAWWHAVDQVVKVYQNFQDDNLRQRAEDLKDISRLVLGQLGVAAVGELTMPQRSGIMVVNDLTPGQVAELDIDKILGVICLEDGRTSHSSILLRSRGIPAIVQAKHFRPSLADLSQPVVLAMDGDTGEIWVNPSIKELKKIHDRQIHWTEQVGLERRDSIKPAVTLDGISFEVFANVGQVEDSEHAANNGADGIGLLRTEFMFLHRDKAPTEDEQVEALHAILKPMTGKPAIIRTLDAGGDKELPYLHMPHEANPYLGVRAIRLCLRNPKIFRQQLRAILRVSLEQNIRIMFPMIAALSELKAAKVELLKAHESLVADGIKHIWPIPTGMMMEVPSAAIMAHYFAPEVDFVSIGTNDLTQYTLAVDRGNPELQELLSKELNPAVLMLIHRIVLACKNRDIPVAVCGEAAASPESASVFLGLGVKELSMNGRSIPAIKHWVRKQSLSEMELAARSLLESRQALGGK